ncbi:MAG TPA: fibronectin type III domain-containing protein, partial [bacterium]|nr:fibronectin type III domain-containing protein [bacterium]
TTRAYVGGSFTKLGDSTVVNGIARWTSGVGWEALGSGVSGGNVYALALSGTKLYVGGDFTSAGGVANTSHIAVWDTATATWSALGSGISNNTVYSIVVNGSDVYVGGNFTDAGGVAAADYIAKWDGVSWSSVGTGTEINNTIRTMAFLGTDLYVGGDFTDAAGYSGGDYIAKWSGSAWSALGDGANNSIYAIIAAGSDLYAGGNFTSIDGSSASRFARYRVPDVTAPSTPTNLTASTGPNQLVLKWKKNSDVDFSKYRIYFGSTSNPTVQTDSSLSISDTSRTMTGLTNGTTYYFRVSAVDIWGNQSSLSTQASGIPNDTVPPSTPSLISATGGNLAVNLTWSKNNDSDFKRYRIYRGTSPGATTQVDSVSIVGDTTKSISAPIPGVTFYFRVRTLDSANNLSTYSTELSASSLDQTPPSTITGLSTTAGDTTVILRWRQSTATDFSKYYIYMDTLALPVTVVDSALTKADTARTFTHLTNGKTYYFRVTAADTFANVSAFSSVASATPFDQTPPSAPQNLAAVASDASVVLHWDANTENDLLRYRVFVGTSSGNEVQTDSTVYDSIVVNGLNNDTEYFFRIAAIDTGKNQSNYSNEVSATPFAANAAPTNPVLLAATAQNQSVVLTWQKNPDTDILKYYVVAGLSSNPTALVDSTNGDTTVTLSGLTNEQAYYFRIIAVDSALQVSGYSNELSQSPYDNVAPATPLNFIASAGDQSAQLTWNNDNTEPIKIYRVFINGTQTDSLTDTTYTVTGLTNYTSYQVSVAAVDSNDNVSSNTSDIGVTPIDLTAPSIPNNLTAEAGDASVHLVWSVNTESDLARYRIFINDVQSDSTSDTSYTATALTNYTLYSFKIAAVDTSGNFSGFVSSTS